MVHPSHGIVFSHTSRLFCAIRRCTASPPALSSASTNAVYGCDDDAPFLVFDAAMSSQPGRASFDSAAATRWISACTRSLTLGLLSLAETGAYFLARSWPASWTGLNSRFHQA